jgi:hypothetical protein
MLCFKFDCFVVELQPNYHCSWSFQFGQSHGRYHCISTMVGTANLDCFLNGPQRLLHDQSSLHQPEVKLLQTCNSVDSDELMDSSDATTNNTSTLYCGKAPWNS